MSRNSQDSRNARLMKAHKLERAEKLAELELKRLEIIDKAMDLLARENRYEPQDSPRAI